jgi:hypothetical protein
VKYILFSVLLFSACVSERKRAKICETCPERITIVKRDSIVQRDTMVYLPGEILRDTIKVECDGNNQPVISIKRPNRGKRGSMNVTRPDVNTIVSECVIDSQAVAITWNERHSITESTEVIVPKQKGVVKWWYALIVSLLCFGVGFVYGKYKK